MSGRPLDGIVVCVTGVTSREELDWIERTVESLGGKFSEIFNEETTCLIAKKVGSDKYRAACTELNIPVVMTQWLKDCSSSGVLMRYENYEVPPFLGFTICCTQVTLEERYELQRKLENHGAKFNYDLLEDKCTHLIAIAPEGDKYTAAKTWGNVYIVNTDWVEECIRRGRYISEQPYLVLPRVNGVRATNASTSRDQYVEAKSSTSIEREHRAHYGGSEIDDTPNGPPPRLEWDRLPSVDLVGHNQSQILKQDIFFISGFNPEQTDYLIQMIMAGGGRRHFVLTMSVTKVFLGPEANERLILDVCKHPCGAKCVMVEWLVKTLVPDYSIDDSAVQQNENYDQATEDRNSLDRFEHEITSTTVADGVRNAASSSSSRTQRRRSLASASVNAPSTGLKRNASEISKERDSSYTSIRRRHSNSKNFTKESQLIDWSHE